jgi:hypothetical protein
VTEQLFHPSDGQSVSNEHAAAQSDTHDFIQQQGVRSSLAYYSANWEPVCAASSEMLSACEASGYPNHSRPG